VHWERKIYQVLTGDDPGECTAFRSASWTPQSKPARGRPHQHESNQQTTSKLEGGMLPKGTRTARSPQTCSGRESVGDGQTIGRTAPRACAGVTSFLGKLRGRPLARGHLLAEPGFTGWANDDHQESLSAVETLEADWTPAYRARRRQVPGSEKRFTVLRPHSFSRCRWIVSKVNVCR